MEELDTLEDAEEDGSISEKKLHLQFELERINRDLDNWARIREFENVQFILYSNNFEPNSLFILSVTDIDDRLTDIGEETSRFEKRVRGIKAGPLSSAREDASSLADEEDDFSVRVITLEGHTDSVECVDFDEPWSMLVTGSADTTVRIWDLSSQHQWALLKGHTGWL